MMPNLRRRFERGAVMVETALSIATLLALCLGAIDLGIVGFLQVTVDAGAFLNAHENVIGVNDPSGPADATHQVLPQINTSSIATTVQTAPSPTVPVDYGYNGTPTEVASSAYNRHGGASMMQPYIQQTNISQTPFSFLGQPYVVRSQASEADWLESVPEWDVANTNYGSAYAAGNSTLNANLFTQGENTPFYYVSFNFIQHCATPGAWGTPAGTRGVCPNSDFLSLATGEYLNIYNWANTAAGVSGAATGSGAGTFEAMACHQRAFATISQFLLAAYVASPSNAYNSLQETYDPYHLNQTGYTNFAQANFFGQTVTGSPSASAVAASAAINEVYGWDVERGSSAPLGTNPGSSPLHPTVGCK